LTRLRATVLLCGLVTSAAWAQTPGAAETEFLVAITGSNGATRVERSNSVPLIPGRVCYEWRIRLTSGDGLVSAREVFELPAPPALWGGVDENDYSSSQLSKDRKISETTMFYRPKDGWISHGWCVAEGDPAGPYSIKVYVGETLLHAFDFNVESVPDSNAQ